MTTYTTKKRKSQITGKPCIAPFINGLNVWDIPEKEWTEAVQAAVARAYWIGMQSMTQIVYEAATKQYAPVSVNWETSK